MNSLKVRSSSGVTTHATYARIPGTDRVAVHLVHIIPDLPECKRRNHVSSTPQRRKPRRSLARYAKRIMW